MIYTLLLIICLILLILFIVSFLIKSLFGVSLLQFIQIVFYLLLANIKGL
jgi:hypothetical protein